MVDLSPPRATHRPAETHGRAIAAYDFQLHRRAIVRLTNGDAMTPRRSVPAMALKGGKLGAMICVPLSGELNETLEALAEQLKTSKAKLVREILADYLAQPQHARLTDKRRV